MNQLPQGGSTRFLCPVVGPRYGGLFFFAAGFVFFWVPGSMLSCFSDFLIFCFSAICFSAFLLLCFSASLFSLFLCFVLLCLSTSTILLFLFLQSCVFAALLPAPLLLCFLSLSSLFFHFLLLYSLLFVS